MMGNAGAGMLTGLRVIEIADERAEYTGLLLAGLGAEVVKIEPPEGNATRRIGPFFEDQPGLERSLFFWNYNRNKKSVVLDLREGHGREDLLRLLGGADILLDASCGALNEVLDLDRATLNARFPALVTARMTPFGDDGPWADFKSSDLIHLALGGVMMNCGYDPDPNLEYDTPPIAPQIWHAYHIAGEQLATGIIAALIHRERSGEGQDVSVAIHEAVSKNPEQDIMYWVMRRVPLWRLTNRHAAEFPNHSPGICHTKDGRWFITHGMGARDLKNLVPLLSKYGAQADLEPPPPDADLRARQVPGTAGSDEKRAHMLDVVQRFVRAWTYKDMPWREAQDAGLLWAPLRKPHENALDEHWLVRKTFADVEHPELGRSFRYPTSKWLATKTTSWQVGRRAPLLGEDTEAVLGEMVRHPRVPAQPRRVESPRLSALHNKPFPLQGIKILDFAWFLASAGGTRFLAAMGAESFKVEWKDNPDTRLAAMAPVGGRAARDAATGPLPGVRDSDMGGQFNNKNAGKRGISLNIRHPKGLQDRQRHDPHLRRRRGGVLTGRTAAAGTRLRRYEVDPPRHHLHPAIWHGRAWHLRADAHGRPGRGGVWRPGRDVGPAGAGDAGRLGLFLPRLDGRLRLCIGIARRDLSPRAHRRGPMDRRLAMRVRHFPDRRDDPRLVGQ
jgi:crotonobetainyl-CoA:carnitine CoA-transferase CaiB-like acyl-CoA transferase